MSDHNGDLEQSSNKMAKMSNLEEEDSGITLVDVLEEEDQLEEDANAVLGGSDDQNCTYSLGYIKRQALYACVTCRLESGDKNQLAGICLACSYHCHDGHELVELYTKRNFCCDCGNSKFPGKCTLTANKASTNEKNSYNHNFKGVYCICNKPYPDPDDLNPDDMVQCVICEDWLHNKHLGQKSPAGSDYSEMACDGCVSKYPFLSLYVSAGDSTDEETKEVCKLDNWVKSEETLKAVFLPSGWRSRLCRCEKCLVFYRNENIEFLIDDQDTVEFYEEKGKAKKCPSHNDRLMMALSTLDRVQQVEAIQEYQSFSAELKEYLKKFAENKKVVREEDIREFFGKLKERKRQRTSIPHLCH